MKSLLIFAVIALLQTAAFAETITAHMATFGGTYCSVNTALTDQTASIQTVTSGSYPNAFQSNLRLYPTAKAWTSFKYKFTATYYRAGRPTVPIVTYNPSGNGVYESCGSSASFVGTPGTACYNAGLVACWNAGTFTNIYNGTLSVDMTDGSNNNPMTLNSLFKVVGTGMTCQQNWVKWPTVTAQADVEVSTAFTGTWTTAVANYEACPCKTQVPVWNIAKSPSGVTAYTGQDCSINSFSFPGTATPGTYYYGIRTTYWNIDNTDTTLYSWATNSICVSTPLVLAALSIPAANAKYTVSTTSTVTFGWTIPSAWLNSCNSGKSQILKVECDGNTYSQVLATSVYTITLNTNVINPNFYTGSCTWSITTTDYRATTLVASRTITFVTACVAITDQPTCTSTDYTTGSPCQWCPETKSCHGGDPCETLTVNVLKTVAGTCTVSEQITNGGILANQLFTADGAPANLRFIPSSWVGYRTFWNLTANRANGVDFTASATSLYCGGSNGDEYISGCQTSPSCISYNTPINSHYIKISAAIWSNDYSEMIPFYSTFRLKDTALACDSTWSKVPVYSSPADGVDVAPSTTVGLVWTFTNPTIYEICPCNYMTVFWGTDSSNLAVLDNTVTCGSTSYTVPTTATATPGLYYWRVLNTPYNIDNPSDATQLLSALKTVCVTTPVTVSLTAPASTYQTVVDTTDIVFSWSIPAGWATSCNDNKQLSFKLECGGSTVFTETLQLTDLTKTYSGTQISAEVGVCTWTITATDSINTVTQSQTIEFVPSCASKSASTGVCIAVNYDSTNACKWCPSTANCKNAGFVCEALTVSLLSSSSGSCSVANTLAKDGVVGDQTFTTTELGANIKFVPSTWTNYKTTWNIDVLRTGYPTLSTSATKVQCDGTTNFEYVTGCAAADSCYSYGSPVNADSVVLTATVYNSDESENMAFTSTFRLQDTALTCSSAYTKTAFLHYPADNAVFNPINGQPTLRWSVRSPTALDVCPCESLSVMWGTDSSNLAAISTGVSCSTLTFQVPSNQYTYGLYYWKIQTVARNIDATDNNQAASATRALCIAPKPPAATNLRPFSSQKRSVSTRATPTTYYTLHSSPVTFSWDAPVGWDSCTTDKTILFQISCGGSIRFTETLSASSTSYSMPSATSKGISFVGGCTWLVTSKDAAGYTIASSPISFYTSCASRTWQAACELTHVDENTFCQYSNGSCQPPPF